MPDYPWKLWIYTNYDCNLSCSYCLAESTPRAARRALGLPQVTRLVDDAAALGFDSVYFTGGEPFLINEIYTMLAYSAQRLPTTVLTNGLLLKGRRLEQLRAVAHPNLTVQVSLDGGQPAHHDPFRGTGSWVGAVAGIQTLLAHGFHVRLATTVTAANSAHLEELCAFHLGLGIPEEDHFARPLARPGFSEQGLTVTRENLLPEITVNAEGAYWHPLTTVEDMLITHEIFPLANVVQRLQAQLSPAESVQRETAKPFR